MKESIESIKDKLKETGFKITPQRRAILEILLENDDKHLSSEEIYDMVRVSCPEIGLATVYRTIQLLSEGGLLSKLNLDDGAESWANKIIEVSGKKETDKQKILDAFDKQGYSTEKCISKLLSIYKID